MSNQPVVQLQGVVKRFAGKPAVDDVDLVVPQGSIFGFIGPNGSGKTTTMRLILRIYQPDAGHVSVLGRDFGSAADDRVGYLPEERGLYRRMTVRRVLRYFARLKGVKNPGSAIDQQLERMGAGEWANKKIEQLSKGMAQKIQFIVATIARPQLVILDEPFSGLDPVNLELMRGVVRELRDEGTTVIFSTHDMYVAQDLCDRVFMIYQGKKVLDGTLDSIREGYGGCQIKVRMAGGQPLPESLVKVTGLQEVLRENNSDAVLHLESETQRPALYQSLARIGDVEHFETMRPSLHDIFVRIARPDSQDGKAMSSTAREDGDV